MENYRLRRKLPFDEIVMPSVHDCDAWLSGKAPDRLPAGVHQ